MKKLMIGIAACCLALSLAAGAMAEQQEQVNIFEQDKPVKSVVFVEGKKEYFLNGKVPGVKIDAAPYINQNRTFVPVRFLGNALGVSNQDISWNTATNKAKLVLGSRSAELTIGKKQLLANGQAKALDVAPELKNNRTYLPARFVAEALGFKVDFVDGMVVCYPEGTERPDISVVKQYLNQQVQGETKNLNGYIVPVKPQTELMIVYGEAEKVNRVELNLAIIVPNRDVGKQCDEAEQILSSKLGSEFAKKVVNVARQKTDYFNHKVYQDFTGPNGEQIEVSSNKGSTATSIIIWSPKGR